MIWFTFKETSPAGTAGPTLAGTGKDVSVLTQRIENRNAGRDLIDRSALREFHLERLIIGMPSGGTDKILKMD